MVDTDREKYYISRKEKVAFPTGRGEATNPENMEALYASVQLWGTEKEGDIPFPSWNLFDEYRDPVDST